MWYFLIFPVIFVLWRAYRFGGVWQIISSLAYIAVSGGISIGIFKTMMKQNLLKKKKKLIAYVVFAVLADQLIKVIINFATELWKRNMDNILNRLQFEAYFQTFSHAVICMHYNGKSEEARELWEKYKDKMPCTNVGKYNSKQVELCLCGENIEELKEKENIKISSLDSLLSNINNYYDDDIYLNKLIIGEIAL